MWQEKDGALFREFKFKDFRQAFEFMQEVADLAEMQNHHPRWQNEWNKVQIWLSTHDENDSITDKDRALADAIDKLLPLIQQGTNKGMIPAVKEIKLYADGGSRGNPGPSATGYVLMDMDDKILVKNGVYLGVTTNNQAEYRALLQGLEEAQKLGAREVHVFMDSLLVVNQLIGTFKIRNRDLWPIHQAIKDLTGQFKVVHFAHVPRELNKLADAQVNLALDDAAKE